MSADNLEPRVSDLEQYVKMLVEMVGRHDARNIELGQSYQTIVELLRKHDERFDEHQTKNAELSQSFQTVVTLLQRHDERLDEVRGHSQMWINASLL
jgi:RNAse (barnase) inhibitor barstar